MLPFPTRVRTTLRNARTHYCHYPPLCGCVNNNIQRCVGAPWVGCSSAPAMPPPTYLFTCILPCPNSVSWAILWYTILYHSATASFRHDDSFMYPTLFIHCSLIHPFSLYGPSGKTNRLGTRCAPALPSAWRFKMVWWLPGSLDAQRTTHGLGVLVILFWCVRFVSVQLIPISLFFLPRAPRIFAVLA